MLLLFCMPLHAAAHPHGYEELSNLILGVRSPFAHFWPPPGVKPDFWFKSALSRQSRPVLAALDRVAHAASIACQSGMGFRIYVLGFDV